MGRIKFSVGVKEKGTFEVRSACFTGSVKGLTDDPQTLNPSLTAVLNALFDPPAPLVDPPGSLFDPPDLLVDPPGSLFDPISKLSC